MYIFYKFVSLRNPDVESPKKDFYWCINCNTTVTKQKSCLKNHETHDLEEETGREMAESHLKSLLITCKAQWNGSLVKHREVKESSILYLSSAKI